MTMISFIHINMAFEKNIDFTQQAIISLVKKISGAWDLGDIAIGVFLDLKKGFDTVPHDVML